MSDRPGVWRAHYRFTLWHATALIAAAAFGMAAAHNRWPIEPVLGVVAIVCVVWLAVAVSLGLLGKLPSAAAAGPIATPEPLWAVAEGWPIRVELYRARGPSPPEGVVPRVAERAEGGRVFLDEVGDGSAVPLDLIDRGPLLVRHGRYGVCLLTPPVAAGGPSP